MLLRTAARSARVLGRRTKADVHQLPGEPSKEWLAQGDALKHHAAQTTDLWRKISLYVCVPIVLSTIAWVNNVEGEHAAHLEHLKEEHGGELPEKPEYPYLNKRSKPFPWGNNSLFFNPKVQKDMSLQE